MPLSPSNSDSMDSDASTPRISESDFRPETLTRPDAKLLTYYTLFGAISGVIPLFPLLAKYYTLQYRFDDEGVSMKWGLLFQHEVYLTYRRVQDIHLTRNLLQRWLGLATVSIQTASGSATPEMKIEGILEADALRDYLYQRMRGARGLTPSALGGPSAPKNSRGDRIEQLLIDIRDALQQRVGFAETGNASHSDLSTPSTHSPETTPPASSDSEAPR